MPVPLRGKRSLERLRTTQNTLPPPPPPCTHTILQPLRHPLNLSPQSLHQSVLRHREAAHLNQTIHHHLQPVHHSCLLPQRPRPFQPAHPLSQLPQHPHSFQLAHRPCLLARCLHLCHPVHRPCQPLHPARPYLPPCLTHLASHLTCRPFLLLGPAAACPALHPAAVMRPVH